MNCWTCGKLDPVKTLVKITQKPFNEIARLWRCVASDAKFRNYKGTQTNGKLVLPPNLGPLLPFQRDYLAKRGFDPDELESMWGFKGIGLIAGPLKWRIFIPIVHNFEMVSYTTRAATDKGVIRYRTAQKEHEKVSIKRVLFGEDHCLHVILVAEGVLDAVKIGPGAVATCGVGYTRSQVLRLAKYPKRVIVFDAEPEGQKAAQKICRELEVFPGITQNVILESGKDPSRVSKQELLELREMLQ